MINRPIEIGFLLPQTQAARIAKRKRRLKTTEMSEVTPVDLIGFDPWPDDMEKTNVKNLLNLSQSSSACTNT